MPEQDSKKDYLSQRTKEVVAKLAMELAQIAPVESVVLLTFPGARRAVLVGLQEYINKLEGGGQNGSSK